MNTQLPFFEGHEVSSATLAITGKLDANVGSFNMDEEVYLIVRGCVSDISHGKKKGAILRKQKLESIAMVILDKEAGERMITEAAILADEKFGVSNLFSNDE
jgi:hypothetical protein